LVSTAFSPDSVAEFLAETAQPLTKNSENNRTKIDRNELVENFDILLLQEFG
jgi:hypothetical protein